jgi:hypothetical protein
LNNVRLDIPNRREVAAYTTAWAAEGAVGREVVLEMGYPATLLFISPDYYLLYPSTAFLRSITPLNKGSMRFAMRSNPRSVG